MGEQVPQGVSKISQADKTRGFVFVQYILPLLKGFTYAYIRIYKNGPNLLLHADSFVLLELQLSN